MDREAPVYGARTGEIRLSYEGGCSGGEGQRCQGRGKDRALAYVKNRVLTGAFPGGELISEGEIAAALGMSRTPVREAFLRLEAEANAGS
jgi:hypothetical protein